MRAASHVERSNAGRLWVVVTTWPLVFNVWKRVDAPVSRADQRAFLEEQVAEMEKVPKHLRVPAWIRNERAAEELREAIC